MYFYFDAANKLGIVLYWHDTRAVRLIVTSSRPIDLHGTRAYATDCDNSSL